MDPKETLTKRKLFANSIGFGNRLSLAEIRQAAESDPAGFMQKMYGAIEKRELDLQSFRLRDMFSALADVNVKTTMQIAGSERAITAGAFPLLVGGMAVAAINAAYEAVPTIGQDLVTEIEDSHKVTFIGAIHALDKNIDEVKETDPFPEISASEEKAEIRSKRNGRMLTVSAEAIEENQVADIVQRVNALGEIAADWIEEQTLARVCDAKGSATTSAAAPYVYRPNGAGTALYSTTANTPGVRAPLGTRIANNALVDEASLETCRLVLADMRNNRNKRIAIPMSECVLLVPSALVGTAAKTLHSEMTPGVFNEINNWGPRGLYQPQLRSTPKLDDISTSAWYLGMPRKQFIRKWKLKFEYVTLSGSTEAFLERRIAFQARIAWDCEIGATDYVYMVQNLASTIYVPSGSF